MVNAMLCTFIRIVLIHAYIGHATIVQSVIMCARIIHAGGPMSEQG